MLLQLQFKTSFFRREKSARRAIRSGGFTLIELCVTMGVILMIAAIATPSVISGQKSANLVNAGNHIADLAAFARQSALSRNAIIALVVKHPNGSDGASVMTMAFDGIRNAWNPLGNWIKLSPEVLIQSNYDDTIVANRIAPLTPTSGGTALAASDYTTLVFYPDGRMPSHGAARRLDMNLGHADGSNFYTLVFNTDTSAFQIQRP